MLSQFQDSKKACQLVRDTLAEFLKDLGDFDQGEPRLVILSKPGLQLVMLGGEPAKPAAIGPTADQPLTASMARDLGLLKPGPASLPEQRPASRPVPPSPPPSPRPAPAQPVEEPEGAQYAEDYRGYRVTLTKTHEGWTYEARSARHGFSSPLCFPKRAAIADAHAHIDRVHHQAERNPPPAPGSPAAETRSSQGGGPYLCFCCGKKRHKACELLPGREMGYKLDQVYLCPTCRNERRAKVTNAAVQASRLEARGAPSSPAKAPAPQPSPGNQSWAAPERQEGPGDGPEPAEADDDPVFTADMF